MLLGLGFVFVASETELMLGEYATIGGGFCFCHNPAVREYPAPEGRFCVIAEPVHTL